MDTNVIVLGCVIDSDSRLHEPPLKNHVHDSNHATS